MRAEEGRAHGDAAFACELSRGAQLLALMLERKTIARLDLDGRNAFGQQRIQARQGLSDELCLARRTRGGHRGQDAAAPAGDVFVRDTIEALLELMRATAGVYQVGVTVDETRRDQPPLAIDVMRRFERRRFALWPGIGNTSIVRGDEAALDDTESWPVGRQRRKVSVSPDAVTVHGGTL